jgi:tRNA-binding protein
MDSSSKQIIEYNDFAKVEMRVGQILTCKFNPKATKPAYILTIDFGESGIKTSSAQLTENYKPEELIGKQIIAVMNFEPKRVAGVKSEVLVLASVSELEGTVLIQPLSKVANGSIID